MRQTLKPGQPVDFVTPDELAALIPRPSEETRIRVPQGVALNPNGAGQVEVYEVPAGYEFEVRRVVLSLAGNLASDPSSGLSVLPTPVDVDATQTGAAAAISAVLPGVAGSTTYLTGFEVTGTGATAASVIVVTVTGILGGTKSYIIAIPAGVTTPITPLQVEFSRPIPASGPNQAITVSVPSFGAGNTNEAVTAHGYQLAAASGKYVAYLRSGSLIEYGQPQYGPAFQIPGVQTWGSEQGPYLQNKEVFEVQAVGLTPGGQLNVYMEGILRRFDTRKPAGN